MRKLLLTITLTLLILPAVAQRASRIHRNRHFAMDQAIRAKILGGYILPFTDFGDISHTPSVGVELSYEFFTNNKTDWPIHWRKPIIGVALQYAYLGNNDLMGQMLALYPYVRWDLSRSDFFIYSMRLGAGFAGMTKTNSANSSHFGFFGNYTMKFQINITGFDWIMFDLGIDAFSNGGFSSKSSPMLMPYASFGYMHRFMPYQSLSTNENDHPYTKPLPYTFMMNIGVEAGALDDWKTIKGTLHFDILGKITNCWATGVGFDAEYGQSISSDTLSYRKRVRGGISWANRFTMNRFHFIIDWGIYAYDPERQFKYFYSYNLLHGHAWNYFRIGAGVRLYDNIYLQMNVHTNGLRVEYTSFGLTYEIPIYRHNYYNKKKKRFEPYQIWHPDHEEGGFKATIHNYIHRPIR